MWRKFFLLLLGLGQKMNAQSRSVLPWTVADCVLFCELRHNQVAPSVTDWRPCKTYVTDCHCWTGNVRLIYTYIAVFLMAQRTQHCFHCRYLISVFSVMAYYTSSLLFQRPLRFFVFIPIIHWRLYSVFSRISFLSKLWICYLTLYYGKSERFNKRLDCCSTLSKSFSGNNIPTIWSQAVADT